MGLRRHLGTGWCQEPDWKVSWAFGGGLDFTRGMSPATTMHTVLETLHSKCLIFEALS